MSVVSVDQDSWEFDFSARRRRLAVTLRSLMADAPAPADPQTQADPVATAEPWDTQSTDPAALATMLAEFDSTRAIAAKRMLRKPLMAARRVNLAMDRLQAANSYTELVRAASAELCWAGDFDRVLFSRVEGSSWLPVAWHVTPESQGPPEAAFADLVRASEIALTSGMIEAEVVRRRVSALVTDAAAESRTYSPLVGIACTDAYVIAPVISGDSVVGIIHADTTSGRPMSEADRVTLRAFADGVGLTLERLALRARLNSQQEQIRAALVLAGQVAEDICAAPVRLARRDDYVAEVPATHIGEQPDDGLTAREREVFSLLVCGATNGQIADRLTVSVTTVKSHVKHILRKLRATNRAEAIALHLKRSHKVGQGG